jgi:N utilization substance protein B
MGVRRKARECALQMLFQWDLTGDDVSEISSTFWEAHDDAPSELMEFADGLTRGVVDHVEEIDPLIERHAENWRLERMATVDRNVLRLATEEMRSDGKTPSTVVINEAIEIARRFSNEGSPKFVNGLLDSIRKELEQTST